MFLRDNILKNTIQYILTRNLFLYIVIIWLFYVLVPWGIYRGKVLNILSVPINPLLEYAQGNKELSEAEIFEYMEYYQTIIQYIPEYPAAYGMLGYCQYHFGNKSKAAGLYQKAIGQFGRFTWFHYNLGAINFNQQDYAKAGPSFERAFRINPGASYLFIRNSKVFDFMDNRYWLERSVEEVTESYESLIRDNLVKGQETSLELALLSYYLADDYNRMLSLAMEALVLEKRYARKAQLFAGMAAYELGLYEKAVEFLTKNIELHPRNFQSYYYLGKTFDKLKRPQQAAQFFIRARRLGWDGVAPTYNKEISLVIF